MPDLHALAGAYVADALDAAERRAFEAHLADCVDCSAEVTGLREALGELSDSIATPPPPQLRNSVLAAIGKEPAPVQTVTALRSRSAKRWLWPATAAACAVIAAVGIGWGVQQHSEASRSADRLSSITGVLTGVGTHTVTGPIGTNGHVTIVYSKNDEKLLLIGRGISAPPRGKTYQLWMISPQGAATSAGVFAPDADGKVLLMASGDLAGTTQMGVSIEPEGGSAQPTVGSIIATMAL